jgi:hypothetical protein
MASGNALLMARVIKYSGRINDMTYTDMYEQIPSIQAAYLGGSDWTISRTFNTGFTGFGFGFIPPSTLPVHLLSFTGDEKNKMAELIWKVEGEDNLSHYTVQRCKDGVRFEDIGMVVASGVPGVLNYNFTDRAPLSGRNYYRLSMQDKDGAKKLSNIVVIAYSGQIHFTVLPNPFRDKLIVNIGNAAGQSLRASLTDMSGKIVARKNSTATAGSSIGFNLPSLAAGIYCLQINDGNEIHVFKVMKE